jgi:hypothetical protein
MWPTRRDAFGLFTIWIGLLFLAFGSPRLGLVSVLDLSSITSLQYGVIAPGSGHGIVDGLEKQREKRLTEFFYFLFLFFQLWLIGAHAAS